MRIGVYVPTFGEYDVKTLAALARETEAAGWDGFFIWDHVQQARRHSRLLLREGGRDGHECCSAEKR